METISNVASAASKAIWGENNPQATTQGNETHGQEPISGQQGKGTVDEPFDQGNTENPTSTTPGTSTYDNTSSGLTGGSSGNTSSGLTGNTTGNTSVLPDRTSTNDKSSSNLTGTSTNDRSASNLPGSSTNDKSFSDLTGTSANDKSTSNLTGTSANDKSSSNLTGPSTTDTTSSSTNPTGMSSSDFPNNPTSVAAGGEPNPHTSTDKTGVIAGREGDATKGSDVIPSERQSNPGAAPASGAGPEFKQQGADKPGDAPTGAEEGAVKEKKNEAEEILAKKDPNDHSGEPMKMHGDTNPKTQAERRESKVGNPGGQEHGKEDLKGTGEEWVKTSGMAVDGGDFDATKPGAGREADRLLEEKGIHKTTPGQPVAEPAAAEGAAGASKGDKPSVGEKIKAKLHLGHKDK